jgi:hypothetical protein
MIEDYSAIYLPSLPPGKEDPSRSGFKTEAEAEAYMFTNLCRSCAAQWQMFLEGVQPMEEYGPDEAEEYPACTYEWVIVPTDKADSNLDELFQAAGWKTIYTKPEDN